jgi:hyperosmotically inducible protein
MRERQVLQSGKMGRKTSKQWERGSRNNRSKGTKMKSKSMYRLVFAVAAVVVFFASAPLFASETDKTIEPAFKNTYVYRTYLKDDAIKTDAKEGVVTLTGTVDSQFHKSLAQEAMASLPGVTSVNNELATKAEVAADNADIWISRKVKFVLLLHRNVNAGQTAVEVNNGIVRLTGQASSAAQKELTTEYVNDIEGVKVVNNEMTVAATPVPAELTAGEKMDDASVTAQVKTALLIHRSTSASKTKVETRDGVVTVTGIAKNAAEISLVTKLVNDIQGVSSVNNQMTVEAAK